MVKVSTPLTYTIAGEDEVNSLLSGRLSGIGYPWPSSSRQRFSQGDIGILWQEINGSSKAVRPLAIVIRPEQHKRFFSRFSQLRSDLSPVSTWAHIFSPERFDQCSDLFIEPDLFGYEAAWAGLAVAEAMLITGRRVSQLKLAACLATQTYVVARALALWGGAAPFEALSVYEQTQKSLGYYDAQTFRNQAVLSPLWNVLAAASGLRHGQSHEYESLISVLLDIRRARETGQDELRYVQDNLIGLPEASVLNDLSDAAPEERLKKFDAVVKIMRGVQNEPVRRVHLGFLLGYMATTVAGGASSLALAEALLNEFPDVLAWSFILGSVGETVSWSSGFDGLGRLITRELERTFHLLDAPLSDFSAAEALVVVDRQLSDPLVHLRIKQSRVATVALMPGVTVPFPLPEPRADVVRQPRQAVDRPSVGVRTDDPWAVVAEALMPHILSRLETRNEVENDDPGRSPARSGRKAAQRTLPLK